MAILNGWELAQMIFCNSDHGLVRGELMIWQRNCVDES